MGGVLSKRKKSANSGIDALLGFEFQRNCALYLLLNDYNRFKGREFFLSIEHHDDFLFCYRTNCRSKIEEVHSYQAKKLSGNVWRIVYALNEQNCKCRYDSVPDAIKNKISKKVSDFCSSEGTSYHESELDDLHLQWVDFPRTKNVQKDCLDGLMGRKFPHVSDSSAAVELLLSLFREVEAIHNQDKVITLLDSSKRVEGDEIKQAIDIIETEQKTFMLWRECSTDLARKFRVPIGIQNNHENHIKNTFKLLKDMTNNEHQIIKSFVKENNYSMDYYRLDEMFDAYVSDIKSKNSLNLSDIDIFFATLCAYVEYQSETFQ